MTDKEKDIELEEDYSQFDDNVSDDDIEETEEDEEVEKDSKKKVKKLDTFQLTIKEYLDKYSNTDETFKTRYDGSNEKIVECCNYIINCVKETKRQGFADEEIYKMARDFYVDDIDKEKCKDSGHGKVVVNHTIELTEAEKDKARKQAIEEYKKKEIKRLEDERKAEEERIKKEQEKAAKKEAERLEKERKKEEERKVKEEKEKAEAKAKGGMEQMSLFDMLGD